MNRLPLFFLLLVLAAALPARAQFGKFGDIPIEIQSGETRAAGGIVVAEHNVLIRYSNIVIYCDYAQYNPDTRDVLVLGNVRIFRDERVFAGERAIYNLETKQLTATDFRGYAYPFAFSADTFNSLGSNGYQMRDAVFTTSDNSKPDYTLRAHGVRIYPNDRVIFRDVFLYVGQTPILWFPYVYQSLNKEQGFLISPGYSGSLGEYLFTRYTFPLTEDIGATLRLDFMSKRGVGIGLETKWEGDNKAENWGRFTAYYLYDLNAGINKTNTAREAIEPSRYRITLQDRTYLTEDIYSTIDINKLSDPRFLQDFEPGLFKRDPNPDNVFALTKWHENYTVTLTGRKSLNDFFDFTERLPELALDVKQQPIFGESGLYYNSETSAGYLRRDFAVGSIFPDYESGRFDTYHQLSFPKLLFGWLSVVPRAGLRGTFYTSSGNFTDEVSTIQLFDVNGNPSGTQTLVVPQYQSSGAKFRIAADAGLEASFKLSRAFEGVQSRTWGLDGFRHVLQPYANLSYVYTNQDPAGLPQFDRVNPSTQLPPIDFPQFNTIDSIDNWTILQLGARNRFQTRRDNNTFTWMEWNGFFNINIDRPEFERTFLETSQVLNTDRRFDRDASLRNKVADPGTFSNVYNNFRWTPVPWMALGLETQLPLLDKGFSEVNTSMNVMATQDLQLLVSHRYLSGNTYFRDSNQLTVGALYRLTDNWGFTVRETYEFNAGLLQAQRYEVHRDLSSWIASFGLVVGNNGGGKDDIGLQLTFTLKDLPMARLPFNLDPSDVTGTGGGSGKNR